MKLRVAHFVGSAEFGGTEQALLSLMTGLQRRGWEQVLLHHPEPRLAPLLEGARELGVSTCVVPRTTSLATMSELFRAIRGQHPGVFHAHLNWPLACRTALVCAKLLHIPARVATVQLFTSGPWPIKGPLQRFVIAPSVGRFIAVSGGIATQLEANFGIHQQKIRVVHNGICVQRFREVTPTRLAPPPVILTTARLDAQKGLPVLLESARLLPEAQFFIAGDGRDRSALVQRAQQLGVSDRVHFLGYRRDVPELIAGCDVFALPSLNEGLPLAVLEAMASGRAVVTSAIPGVVEAVVDGQTGVLVAPGDAAALASGLRQLIAEPARARRLGAAGRDHVERWFSAEAMVEGVETVYEELLSAGRKPGATRVA